MSDITLVLDAINRGESQASEKLLPAGSNEAFLDGHVEWRAYKTMNNSFGNPLFQW